MAGLSEDVKLSDEIKKKVQSYVQENREKLISDLQKMIQIPSESGYEGEVQEHIRQKMVSLGLEVDTFEADETVRSHPEYTLSEVETKVGFEGRPNVRGVWKAEKEEGKSLLMFTHVDTVPVGDPIHWSYDPTGGEIKDGIMYGRGTADNKGGFGSLLAALEIIKGLNLKPKADITTVSVVDEEVGGAAGAVALMQKLEEEKFQADACIYPHPLTPGLAPQIACAGGLVFKIKVKGLAAHNLNGQVGVNAIGKMNKIYDALIELDQERIKTVNYEPFKKYFELSDMEIRSSNLTPAIMSAGDWAYKVPAECELTATIGYPPNETVEEVKEQILNAVNKVVENDEWLQEHKPEVTWEWHTNAAETPADHPFVQMVKRNIDETVEKDTDIIGMPTFSDIRLPIIYLGMPTIIYGPTGGNLHGADEWLNIDEWIQTVEINVLNILEWCGYEEA